MPPQPHMLCIAGRLLAAVSGVPSPAGALYVGWVMGQYPCQLLGLSKAIKFISQTIGCHVVFSIDIIDHYRSYKFTFVKNSWNISTYFFYKYRYSHNKKMFTFSCIELLYHVHNYVHAKHVFWNKKDKKEDRSLTRGIGQVTAPCSFLAIFVQSLCSLLIFPSCSFLIFPHAPFYFLGLLTPP